MNYTKIIPSLILLIVTACSSLSDEKNVLEEKFELNLPDMNSPHIFYSGFTDNNNLIVALQDLYDPHKTPVKIILVDSKWKICDSYEFETQEITHLKAFRRKNGVIIIYKGVNLTGADEVTPKNCTIAD